MEDVKESIRRTYTKVLESQEGCGCGPSCCTPSSEAGFSESYEKVSGYNPEADYGMGCGIPTEFADIKEGSIVLDLGSGAGNDAFVARRLTGPSGKVYGVDMTIAMVNKARENASKLGYDNVQFFLGEIERLPLDDNTMDVVLSNCVMNLVPDKDRAYREVYRVLKPGGHFSISDIVLSQHLPDEMLKDPELVAACISGAVAKEDYLNIIRNAGFEEVTVNVERPVALDQSILKKYSLDTQESVIESISVSGRKS